MMKGIQITHFAFLTTQKNHYQEIIAFAIIAFMGEINYLFTFWKILKQNEHNQNERPCGGIPKIDHEYTNQPRGAASHKLFCIDSRSRCLARSRMER
jgi:hypothetical protein